MNIDKVDKGNDSREQQHRNVQWRHYACGNIVFEDDFAERDNSIPFYDDYAHHEGTLEEYDDFLSMHG